MKQFAKEQLIPLFLTIATFFGLVFFLYLFITFLNFFPFKEKIIPQIRLQDILVGLTIYLKTSVDFAIFIANLMKSNPGWKKRIAIETGTAIGNMSGTIFILVIWSFFREVPILMAIMVIIASLVLLRMAEESFEEFLKGKQDFSAIHSSVSFLKTQLGFLNKISKPILGLIIPDVNVTSLKTLSFVGLAAFSITIPFILGLDDFAGYIPLFSIINVFGFAIGVFLGHMILNLALFLSPRMTVKVVELPLIQLAGGLAFAIIAAFGLFEVIKLFSHL